MKIPVPNSVNRFAHATVNSSKAAPAYQRLASDESRQASKSGKRKELARRIAYLSAALRQKSEFEVQRLDVAVADGLSEKTINPSL